MATCVLCERFKQPGGRVQEPTFKTEDYENIREYTCPRCGRYRTYRSFADGHTAGLEIADGLAVSGLARMATDHGEQPLEVGSSNLAALVASAPIPQRHAAYIDNLLVEVATRSKYPGTSTGHMCLEQIAARAFLPFSSCLQLFSQLQDRGLLLVRNKDPLRFDVLLEPPGWERVDELQRGGPTGNRVFVAMWFGELMHDAYKKGIRPALETQRFEGPFRVDDLEHESRIGSEAYEQKIDERIMAEIRRARFVVADITGARQAVYYEAGFAAGLGIPVIWTGKADSFERDKCFDTQQFAHIIWADPSDLRRKLTNLLRARGWEASSKPESA